MTQKNETSSKTPQPRKVFDVARPGSARPNTSSRPIITTNRSVQDPMVTRDGDNRAPSVDIGNVSANSPSTAPPLPNSATADDAVSQNTPTKVAISAAEAKPEAEAVSVTSPTPDKTAEANETSEENSQPNTAPKPDDIAEKSELETLDTEVSVPEKPVSPSASTTPTEKPAQDIDALIHDDDLETRVLHDLKDVTYEGSQSAEVEQPHLGHAILISAIVLLIVIIICLDVLLDAGAITIPGVPHTQFINTYQP